MHKRHWTQHGAETAQTSENDEEKEDSGQRTGEKIRGHIQVCVGIVNRVLCSFGLVVYAVLYCCARAVSE